VPEIHFPTIYFEGHQQGAERKIAWQGPLFRSPLILATCMRFAMTVKFFGSSTTRGSPWCQSLKATSVPRAYLKPQTILSRTNSPAAENCSRRGNFRLVDGFADGCRFQPPPNVFTEQRFWPAAARIVRAASASALILGTTSTAARAPECRPRPAGAGRRSAGRSPGSCHSPGRRHRARAFRGPDGGRPQHVAAGSQAPIPAGRRALPRCALPDPPSARQP
jgi:hypothetical protein